MKAAADRPGPPLRYVVLRHDGIADPHFDLMLELEPGGDLTTWRSPVWPVRTRLRLMPLPAHRPAYLDYEGPLTGGRGVVTRVASGTLAYTKPSPGTWDVVLTGLKSFDGLQLRTWTDSKGTVLWDVMPMLFE